MSDHTQQEQAQPEQQQQESSHTPLFKIGEREYDVEAAKTKIEHADKHVQTIEGDNAKLRQEVEQLRAQVASASKLDQVLDTLQANQVANPTSTEGNTTPSVDKEALLQELLDQLDSKIEGTLTAKQQQQRAQKAMEEVASVAQAKYGSEYETILRQKGAELGYNDAEIVEFATTKPEAFKRLFGLEQGKVASQGSPSSSVVVNNQTQGEVQPDVSSLFSGWSKTDQLANLQELRKQYQSKLQS